MFVNQQRENINEEETRIEQQKGAQTASETYVSLVRFVSEWRLTTTCSELHPCTLQTHRNSSVTE